MILKDQAKKLVFGDHLYNMTRMAYDGSPLKVKVNGACKIWKTRPDDFSIPVKYGLYEYSYVTQLNAEDWRLTEEPEKTKRISTKDVDWLKLSTDGATQLIERLPERKKELMAEILSINDGIFKKYDESTYRERQQILRYYARNIQLNYLSKNTGYVTETCYRHYIRRIRACPLASEVLADHAFLWCHLISKVGLGAELLSYPQSIQEFVSQLLVVSHTEEKGNRK